MRDWLLLFAAIATEVMMVLVVIIISTAYEQGFEVGKQAGIKHEKQRARAFRDSIRNNNKWNNGVPDSVRKDFKWE